ncbi:MAG: hypothetical protein E6Q97_21635 [Desulfurellales bacterium]|nr:MAG: hypothetical protein E6Q97_21635 [Desulfurellales bacterium]
MSDIDIFTIEKQSADIRSRSVDFSKKVPDGVTIESATVLCVVAATNENVSDDMLASTDGTVDDSAVVFTVQGGENGELYKITVTATLSTGDILTADLFMRVRDY